MNYMSSAKVFIICLRAGYIKKIALNKYLNPNSYWSNKAQVEFHLTNYATRFDVKMR